MNFSTETVGGFRQVDSQSESTHGNKKKWNKPFIYLKYQNIVVSILSNLLSFLLNL